MIEFNKVTWYSRLGALILFIGVIPTISFYLGMQYANVQFQANAIAPITQVISQPSRTLIAKAVYTCDASKFISAVFYEGPKAPEPAAGEPPMPAGSVVVSLDGHASTTLKQTISASGVRYANADESLVFWNKGNTALIMRNNTMDLSYSNCAAK